MNKDNSLARRQRGFDKTSKNNIQLNRRNQRQRLKEHPHPLETLRHGRLVSLTMKAFSTIIFPGNINKKYKSEIKRIGPLPKYLISRSVITKFFVSQ